MNVITLLSKPPSTSNMKTNSKIHLQRFYSTSAKKKTGILMMNMGGPSKREEVAPFLYNLFTDRDIIQMPIQSLLGPFLAKRRTPNVTNLYEQIGFSPIYKYTKLQGEGMIHNLQKLSETSKSLQNYDFKYYVAFRYTYPRAKDALAQMKEDGIERAIAFSQYPQFSCTTSGSSLNELWKEYKTLNHPINWSIIDRWPINEFFIRAVVKKIKEGLQLFTEDVKNEVVILFSAHSLPLKTVSKGDQYPAEVAATVYQVMKELQFSHRYSLVWQSQVGKIPWLGPQTSTIIEDIGKNGRAKGILVIPIAFTSDHIETLFEIDIEMKHIADKYGLPFHRSPSLNDDQEITTAFAHIVSDHIEAVEQKNSLHSLQYTFKCPSCQNPSCRTLPDPAIPTNKSL